MPDNTVDIVIRTKAELDGVKAYAKELERSIGVQKAMGRDSSEMSAKLGQVRAALAQVAPELRGFSGLVGALISGGPVTAAIAVLGAFAGAIVSVRQKLSSLAEAEAEVGQVMGTVRQQIDQTAPLSKYEKALARMATAADLATLKLQGLEETMAAVHAADDALAEAAKDREMAGIDLAVAGGRMSKAEGDIRKAEVEGSFMQGAAVRRKAFLTQKAENAARGMNVQEFAAMAAREDLAKFEGQMGFQDVGDAEQAQKAAEAEAAKQTGEVQKLEGIRQQLEETIRSMEAWVKPKTKAERLGRGAASTIFGALLGPFAFLKPALEQPTAEMLTEYNEAQEQLANLNQSIEGKTATADAAATRSANLKLLQRARLNAQQKADGAATTRTKFEGQRTAIEAERSAIDPTTRARLETLGLRTATSVIGDVEQQARVVDASPKISAQGQAVARAIAQMGNSFEQAMVTILQAVQQNTNRVNQLENRASRRELR
jgi:hypothetical protein